MDFDRDQTLSQPPPSFQSKYPSNPSQQQTSSASVLSSQLYSVPPDSTQPPQSYTVPLLSQQPHSSQQLPESYSAPLLSQQPHSSQQPPISSYYTPQTYPSYQLTSSDERQQLPYPQPYQPYQSYAYDSSFSAQNVLPALTGNAHQSGTNDPHPSTRYQAAPYQNAASQTIKLSQPKSRGDPLAEVLVQDGEDPQSFTSAKALKSYLDVFPEADNDQACRVFTYSPKCPTSLLMPLFEHFNFPRFSVFPYGFASDFSIADHWGAGSCKCQSCMKGQLCGHYVLHKNFRFYAFQNVTPSFSTSPKITSTEDATIIFTADSAYKFHRADWNLQFFRFRSRKLRTTVYGFDALVYQNHESEIKLKSSPLNYVISQLDVILINWDSILNASSQFLSSFRVEILEERLETDRSIVRNLLVAAQHWEEFRRVLHTQLKRLKFFENIHGDPRWTEGHDNHFEILAIASGYLQRFRAIEYRITTELMQETDTLVQKVSNLIAIDEGYRSRDQNESIRRLTWITFIFLPLIFTAGIFSMQVDLFDKPPAWHYYIYTSLIFMFIVFSSYALLRSRRRLTRHIRSMTFSLIAKCIRALAAHGDNKTRKNVQEQPVLDLEKQPISSTKDIPTVLKWAASSGRTDLVRNILQVSTKKMKLTPGMSGQALFIAIQNGHSEAAALLINTQEGLSYTDEDDATALHWAARMGQSTICQQLLEKGASLAVKDRDNQTALDWAIGGGDELTINLLLNGLKGFTRQETSNLQSLHFSARTGDLDTIKEFQKQGSSLEVRDGKGQTVLFHAVKGGQHDILKWLTEEGQANVKAIDKEGLTALHVAAQVCDVKSAELLIRLNANVNARSSKNLTPLHCIPHSEGVRFLIFLHGKGADINAIDKDNNRLTHKAASRGDSAASLFQAASDLGADIEAPGSQGNTPTHLAAQSGSKAILEILAGKNVKFESTRNSSGYTPLMMASQAGRVEVIHYLLEKGISYDVVDSGGRSLIELTIGWGNPEVIATLQKYGANYSNITSVEGDVHPVWKAIYEGQSASVANILDSGLSIEYQHRGVRILQLAIEANNEEVVRLLIERGAAVDVADMCGWTAMHSAAYTGNVELLLLILQKVDNTTPRDQQGWTPLDIAAFHKHDKIVKLLDPEGKIKKFAWIKSGYTSINATNYHRPSMVDSVIFGVAEASAGAKEYFKV